MTEISCVKLNKTALHCIILLYIDANKSKEGGSCSSKRMILLISTKTVIKFNT